jgi:hypothetical protein
MRISTLSLSMIVALSLAAAADSRASGPGAPVAVQTQLTADQLAIPADLLAQINRCNCFTSVTAWQVDPIGAPAEVFSSDDLLFAILDLDIQLPWVGVGEIPSKSLVERILRSGRPALNAITSFGDASGGGFRVGLYAWSHPTAPDFCSGETLDLMYFPRTGVLVAFRFDSSHEC